MGWVTVSRLLVGFAAKQTLQRRLRVISAVLAVGGFLGHFSCKGRQKYREALAEYRVHFPPRTRAMAPFDSILLIDVPAAWTFSDGSAQ